MISNITISALLIGFLLDSIFGDPYWLPHPIRLFGRIISSGEKRINKGTSRKLKGCLFVSIVLIGVFSFFYILIHSLQSHPYALLVVSSVFVFYGIANRSLIHEAMKVENAVQTKSLPEARQALSMIVGRETDQLSKHQIRQAVLETLAENLSDGVIAPLFFYAVAGVPGIMTYKMANTFDSMIGYKSERFKKFGFFAAKLDDLLNFIPARLTALLMAVLCFSFRSFRFVLRYGHKHSSPNAGYPEAALAGILNVRFGGPNYYHGKLVNKPYIGAHDRSFTHSDLLKTYGINILVTLVFIGMIVSCL